MHHSRRKSFDWYGLKQHFSIRKYHFGAASVLLGMSIALGTGTQVVQAAETVTTPESTSVASSTSATESTTSETSTETATSSSSERTVEIGYIVKYATEEGTLVNASVETVSVTTTETIAKATVSVTAVVPEGYELAAGQAATVSQEVTENGVNIVTVKVVKKAEEKAATSETTTTASTETATAKSTEGAATTTATVSEAVKTPATVEEAKTVLEQVTSEAEVLANESERLVAASDKEDTALTAAAAATKLTATQATAVLKDSVATLDEVNAQINAVRTSVEALVLELRKYLVTDSIAVSLAATTALATVTPMEDGSQRPGYWTENEEVLNKAAATATATTKPQKQNIPAGYEVDPTDGRITFLIYSLSADDVDATVTPGTKDGSYNKRYGTDYYITLSMDRVPSTGNIYARLVSKQKGFIEEIEIPENTARHQFQKIANGPKDLGEFTYRMSLTTMPFTDSTGQQTSVRYANIDSGVGANGKGSVVYSLLTSDRTSYNSYTGVAPSYLPIQVTSYYVKETERRAQELLASYAHVAMVSGDSFTISDAAEFANYELIEAPVIKDAPVSTNYSVGTPLIQYFPASKSARVIYVAKEDGTARFLNFVLNPDHPDFIENFKNYHSMSAVDFNTNGGAEALDFTNRIAIVNKYLAEIEAVNADTSLTSDQQASRLAEIRANYASEINTDDNKFLLTFVSTEAEPQSANDGPDAVTGLTTWTHTVKNYYTLYSNGNLVTTIAFKIGSYMSDPMVDWSPTAPTPQGAKLHSKTELDKDGIAARVNITVNQDGVEKEVGADLHSNIIAMYNMLTANENNQNYYYAEKGGVKVYYVDTEGNVLQDSKSIYDHANTNTAYDTKSVKDATITTADGTVYYYKEIDKADLKPASSNTDTEKRAIVKITEEVGSVERDTLKELTYVYEQAGNVIVHYVTEDGTELSGTTDTGATTAATVNDTTNGKPGETYNTTDLKPKTITTADGKTYALVEASTKGEETGTVEAGKTKEVTYVYKEVKGNVVVKYVDVNGNPISGTADKGVAGKEKEVASEVEDTPLSSTTNTGNGYDTTDNRPNTITTADGKIYKLVPAATQGKEEGDIVEGTTTVTYVYELLQGDVVVHYVDTKGNTIAKDVTDTQITDTGTDYNTKEDNKPEKIVNDETGDVYYILPKDEVKAGDKETGKVVEGTTEVTYIYQKAGSVNVNYVDTEGNVLKEPVADVTDAKPGSGYDTVLDNKLASISVDGKLYRLVPAGTYNVGTVSGDNNLTAVGNGKATGIDATTGTVEAGKTKEITYVYEEVKGDVVVEYYDTEGNTIAKTEVDTPTTSVDTPYETYDHKPATITVVEKDGSETLYYYKEVKDTSAPEKGDVVEGTTTVQYVYEKAGNVNVNYVDTEGNPIQAPVADETNEKAGTEYATADNKPTTITTADGKTYRLVEAGTYNVGTVSDDNNLTAVGNGKATGIDATTGTVEAGTTKEITYVYEEVKGNVVVNYITTDGTVIKQPVEDTPTSSTGTPYDTKDNKPTTITTEDGKTYRIVPVLTKGSETGKVVEGTTSITYVYEEVKGDVVVEYYDTEGNLISGLSDSGEAVDTKEVDTPSTSTGTEYNTDEDHKPNTITTADGTVYYYKEVKDTSASTTGKVVEGTTTVQYVYEKAGNVIVHYITEDGTVIKATVTDEENAEPGKSYDTTDNKPTTITTEDGSRYVLIPSKTIGTENGTVEGGKTIEITYVYKKVANWIPQIPGVPEGQEPKVPYPFDPNNPDVPVTPTPDTVIPNVPGYTPVDPKTNEPLKPVDPTDPGKGYVPPTPDDSGVDTPIPYVQNGNVVVNYVDENGNVLKTPVNDETDAPAGKSYDTTDNKPTEIVTEDGSRYVLIPSKTIGTENGTVEGGKTIEITYVYKKVANWVPQIPGVPEGQEPKVPYPFDPTNPDVPVTPTPDTVIPNVPGYTPVDPKTNEPLKPVDPTDPGKGYVPPTPDDSSVDTPIPYVQNGNVVVNYVDENGNVLKTPVNDETDAPAGTSYDTTDNKPTEIVTEDGSRYVLIPSKTIGTENGTVEGGKTTEVTYVYRKVETPAKKVVTNHVDEDGNPIAPQEEGTTPNKSIPGYEFTGKTVTDPDGNTTHIYRKVTKVVTNHVDEDGNPIAPQEEGTTPNKSIPGYEFTGKTVTDPDGNTTHIYRKVSKPVAPKPQAPVAPTTAKAGAAQLPNTGEASSSATVLGAAMLVAAIALAGKRRRNED
ncbi:TPA: MucBP domain-containing protein [Streptococcus suis]|nr:MucBP domain-containing protein [Streptococcus suis]